MSKFSGKVGGAAQRDTFKTFDDWVRAVAADRVVNPNPNGDGFMTQCPAHPDNNPSLSVKWNDETKHLLLNCFAGCDNGDILRGFRDADLPVPDRITDRDTSEPEVEKEPEIVGTDHWVYEDAGAEPVLRVTKVRFDDGSKTFIQSKMVDGGWVPGGMKQPPIYRLPDVILAKGQTVYICEGEKDADSLVALGLCATTNPGGAGNWKDWHTEQVADATEIIVIIDNDEAGERRGQQLLDELPNVTVLRPAFGIKDLTDHLDEGFGISELEPFVAASTSPEIGGRDFIFGRADDIRPIWGAGNDIAWSSGESLMIAGRTGAKKTTFAHALMWARLGLVPNLLDLPVEPTGGRILYLAMDRPKQIQRSMRRALKATTIHLTEEIADRLWIWQGPIPSKVKRENGEALLYNMAEHYRARTIFIDSLKDLVGKLSDEEAASEINAAINYALARGIEIVILHHERKGNGSGKSDAVESVYGSTMITAGAGSVFRIEKVEEDDKKGEPRVISRLTHTKEPATNLGTMTCIINDDTGEVLPVEDWSALSYLVNLAPEGVDVRQATAARLAISPMEVKAKDKEKTRRILDRLVEEYPDVQKVQLPGSKGMIYRYCGDDEMHEND